MRFDYYGCTIQDSFHGVLSTLAKLGDRIERCDGLAKVYHYSDGYSVQNNLTGLACRVLVKDGGYPHAFASSDSTDAFCDLVRSEWPGKHLVTRFDPCQDFYDGSASTRIREVMEKIAKKRRMTFKVFASPLDKTDGDTVYLGSSSSAYRARFYDKGWEVYGKVVGQCGRKSLKMDPQTVFFTPPGTSLQVRPSDWVRLELQARPDGEDARFKASFCTPEQAWGFTDWSYSLAEEVFKLGLERTYIKTRKLSDDESSLRWMVRQYSKPLKRLFDDLGGWDCVGLQIGELIKLIEKERR